MNDFINALPGAVSQGLIWGIMAIGVYLTYSVLQLSDLTVDGSICTGAAVFVMAFTTGTNLWLALLLATLAGMAAGLVTGLLHTVCGIPAILAGILTQLGLWSVNMRIMGMKATVAINVTNKELLNKLLVSLRFIRDVAQGELPFWRHPIVVVGLFTAVVIGVLYWFFGTELGCSLRATGANQNMAKAQGINVNMAKVLGLMIANGLVALSGALLAQYNSASEINMGRGAIVIGLAAVIIGDVLFSKLFRNFALKLFAVSVGAIVYYIVIQAVLAMGLNTNDLKILSAAVVALFLSMPTLRAHLASKNLKKGAARNA
ncbi:MAG: ABC transporter permease [Faecalibacterium sp.]|nr:ABC transporter permease [Faecalibacterium sp.]